MTDILNMYTGFFFFLNCGGVGILKGYPFQDLSSLTLSYTQLLLFDIINSPLFPLQNKSNNNKKGLLKYMLSCLFKVVFLTS